MLPLSSLLNRLSLALVSAFYVVINHLKRHGGVGIICAVAYFDPGNWSVNLQAGSNFGYRPMLFVLLIAGLGAIVLQTLACKLGCVTGLDLAAHCRLLLYNRTKHPRRFRWILLYPLYVLCEIAMIATDLAELLGSAIGICLLIPRLPLWSSVVITATDVIIFLVFTDPSRAHGRPARVFELCIILLVFVVLSCFLVLLVRVKPDWPHVFLGYLPSSGLFQSQPSAIYSAVGILGATVMPHALFLGSSLASQNRVSPNGDQVLSLPSAPRRPRPTTLKARATELFAPLFRVTRAERVAAVRDLRTRYGEHENNRLAFVRQHLGHSITDIVSSLLFIAIPINSAILIVSATVFYADPNGHLSTQNSAGLFNAHDLIKAHIGSGAATVFAVALVCAGQTSSITATLSGQIVSEGFLDWRISPFLRRLVTRLISLIPATVVAAAVGREGINALLVASQVTLSVVLPFIAFPLLYLTSSKAVMRIRKPLVSASALAQDGAVDGAPHPDAGAAAGAEVPSSSEEGDNRPMAEKVELEASAGSEETIDYSNGWVFTIVAYFIWVVVVAANVYAIVSLGLN